MASPAHLTLSLVAVMTARLLTATGTLQRKGRVLHVVAEGLTNHSASLRRLRNRAIDSSAFDGAMSRPEEPRREPRDRKDAMPEGRISGEDRSPEEGRKPTLRHPPACASDRGCPMTDL